MVMAACGTFDCTFVVPDQGHGGTRQMKGTLRDTTFETNPAELRVGDVTRILHEGRPTIGDYEILVQHGRIWGIPGTDECVSIERRMVCPKRAAHNSAQLMETEEDATRLDR